MPRRKSSYDSSPNIDEDAVQNEYRNLKSRLDSLCTEACSIIDNMILKSNVKVSSVDHRTKSIDSVVTKCRRKGVSSLSGMTDLVGIRVICLFRSDITRIVDRIRSTFEEVEVDDKVNSSATEFGYMSVHCICKLPQHYAGPRYDNIKCIKFEIQVRTVAMHAWAVISHFIEYKNEVDVPAELRRSLNALSALFHVADTQFEAFSKEALASKGNAVAALSGGDVTRQPLNYDILQAFGLKFFSDRKQADDDNWSQLLEELLLMNITNAEELARYITYKPSLVDDYEIAIERDRPPFYPDFKQRPHFSPTGAIRVTLDLLSEKYQEGRSFLGEFVQKFRQEHHLPNLDTEVIKA